MMGGAISVLEMSPPDDLDHVYNPRIKKNNVSESTSCMEKQTRTQYASLVALPISHLRQEEGCRGK
jgi:hypothetical protein